MPDLKLDDISLHYEVDGAGPPLLLIAGMLSDSASWGPLTALLAPHFTVIRTDNRTTGRTTPWDAEVSVQHNARDAMALMDHLGHETFHVVGHSMGGLVAMELWGLAKERLASMTIMASAPVRSPRTMAVFDALLEIRRAEGGEELWLKSMYPWVFTPDYFLNPKNIEVAMAAALAYPYGQSADAMAHQMDSLRNFRPTVRPTDIGCPTLVLDAEDEILIPKDAAAEAFAAISDVRQITVPNAGHSIHWDAPQTVARHIRDFILEGTS